MQGDLVLALKKASVGTLESMAFLLMEPVESCDLFELAYGVRIEFIGEQQGVIEVWTGEGLLGFLAENILAEIDESQSIEQGLEALKEITNITAGHFLTEYFGVHKVFDLGIPYVVDKLSHFDSKIVLLSLETNLPILIQSKVHSI